MNRIDKMIRKILHLYRICLIPVLKFIFVVRIGEINKKGFHAKTYSFNMWHPITWVWILYVFVINMVINLIMHVVIGFVSGFNDTYKYFDGNKFFYKRIRR